MSSRGAKETPLKDGAVQLDSARATKSGRKVKRPAHFDDSPLDTKKLGSVGGSALKKSEALAISSPKISTEETSKKSVRKTILKDDTPVKNGRQEMTAKSAKKDGEADSVKKGRKTTHKVADDSPAKEPKMDVGKKSARKTLLKNNIGTPDNSKKLDSPKVSKTVSDMEAENPAGPGTSRTGRKIKVPAHLKEFEDVVVPVPKKELFEKTPRKSMAPKELEQETTTKTPKARGRLMARGIHDIDDGKVSPKRHVSSKKTEEDPLALPSEKQQPKQTPTKKEKIVELVTKKEKQARETSPDMKPVTKVPTKTPNRGKSLSEAIVTSPSTTEKHATKTPSKRGRSMAPVRDTSPDQETRTPKITKLVDEFSSDAGISRSGRKIKPKKYFGEFVEDEEETISKSLTTAKAKSPIKKLLSPVSKLASPVKKIISPVRKIVSPIKKAISPFRKTASPIKNQSKKQSPKVSPPKKKQQAEHENKSEDISPNSSQGFVTKRGINDHHHKLLVNEKDPVSSTSAVSLSKTKDGTVEAITKNSPRSAIKRKTNHADESVNPSDNDTDKVPKRNRKTIAAIDSDDSSEVQKDSKTPRQKPMLAEPIRKEASNDKADEPKQSPESDPIEIPKRGRKTIAASLSHKSPEPPKVPKTPRRQTMAVEAIQPEESIGSSRSGRKIKPKKFFGEDDIEPSTAIIKQKQPIARRKTLAAKQEDSDDTNHPEAESSISPKPVSKKPESDVAPQEEIKTIVDNTLIQPQIARVDAKSVADGKNENDETEGVETGKISNEAMEAAVPENSQEDSKDGAAASETIHTEQETVEPMEAANFQEVHIQQTAPAAENHPPMIANRDMTEIASSNPLKIAGDHACLTDKIVAEEGHDDSLEQQLGEIHSTTDIMEDVETQQQARDCEADMESVLEQMLEDQDHAIVTEIHEDYEQTAICNSQVDPDQEVLTDMHETHEQPAILALPAIPERNDVTGVPDNQEPTAIADSPTDPEQAVMANVHGDEEQPAVTGLLADQEHAIITNQHRMVEKVVQSLNAAVETQPTLETSASSNFSEALLVEEDTTTEVSSTVVEKKQDEQLLQEYDEGLDKEEPGEILAPDSSTVVQVENTAESSVSQDAEEDLDRTSPPAFDEMDLADGDGSENLVEQNRDDESVEIIPETADKRVNSPVSKLVSIPATPRTPDSKSTKPSENLSPDKPDELVPNVPIEIIDITESPIVSVNPTEKISSQRESATSTPLRMVAKMKVHEKLIQNSRKRSLSASDADVTKKNVTFHSPANSTILVDTLDERLKKSFKHESASKTSMTSSNRKRALSEHRDLDKHSSEAPKPPKLTKLPNFKSIHQKQFDQMESIDALHNRKIQRAKEMTSACKSPGLVRSIEKPSFGSTAPPKSPGKFGFCSSSSSSSLISKPSVVKALISSGPVKALHGSDAHGSRPLLTDVERQEKRQKQFAATFRGKSAEQNSQDKPDGARNVIEQSRHKQSQILKGVRTNKRFELLMKFRDTQD
ncbi:titin-like [Uranotaenia lowii]|uniref:titin-like n=1 Tax=Uranotaenia lowii TaxID=190385 RepID=UPI002479F41B|nr:titin-like [Uranotaenia lowii]